MQVVRKKWSGTGLSPGWSQNRTEGITQVHSEPVGGHYRSVATPPTRSLRATPSGPVSRPAGGLCRRSRGPGKESSAVRNRFIPWNVALRS